MGFSEVHFGGDELYIGHPWPCLLHLGDFRCVDHGFILGIFSFWLLNYLEIFIADFTLNWQKIFPVYI
jgi:hypothetical protein